MTLQLPRQSTIDGVLYELDAGSDFGDQYGSLNSGDANHPAHAAMVRQQKYALHSSLLDPHGAIPANFYGATVSWLLKNCGSYLYRIDLTGLFGAVTTSQADGNTVINTLYLKQLAAYQLQQQVKFKFGCDKHELVESGFEWIILYNRVINTDQRLGGMVIDGDESERVNISRRPHMFSAPMLFDFFTHTSRALRVASMKDSMPEIEILFNTAEEIYHRTGNANPGINPGTAPAFLTGTLTNVRLRLYYIQLPAAVDEQIRARGGRRITYIRTWCHHRVSKPNTTAELRVDLPNVKGNVVCWYFRPENDQYHSATFATRLDLGATTNPDHKLHDRTNHYGAWFTDGAAAYQREPFTGVQVYLGTGGNLRWNEEFEKMFMGNTSTYFSRVPSRNREKVAIINHEPYWQRNCHKAGIALGGTHGNYVLFYHDYAGMTCPAWGGYMTVSWQWDTIFITEGTIGYFVW